MTFTWSGFPIWIWNVSHHICQGNHTYVLSFLSERKAERLYAYSTSCEKESRYRRCVFLMGYEEVQKVAQFLERMRTKSVVDLSVSFSPHLWINPSIGGRPKVVAIWPSSQFQLNQSGGLLPRVKTVFQVTRSVGHNSRGRRPNTCLQNQRWLMTAWFDASPISMNWPADDLLQGCNLQWKSMLRLCDRCLRPRNEREPFFSLNPSSSL